MIVADVGLIVTVTDGGGAGSTVMVALALFEGSAELTAEAVTVLGLGIEGGAV